MLSVTTLRNNSGPAAFLPSDILEIIFMLLVQDERTYTVFTNRSAPHNISRVNRHWRDVALHRKSLWRTFIADLSSSAAISQHLMHFRCYLERCGPTLPIDITVTTFNDDDAADVGVSSIATDDDDSYSIRSDGDEEASRELAPSFSMIAMDRCMELLAQQCTRWRDVELVFPHNAISTDIMASYICSTWPMELKGLTSLRDLYFDFPKSTQYDPAILDLSDSQLIERAYISGFVYIHLEPDVTLPNLTHLTLNLFRKSYYTGPWEYNAPDSEQWVFKTLEQMPSLTFLSVVTTKRCPLTIRNPRYPPVTLASLTRLEVICNGVDDELADHYFLRTILCPSLQELTISSTVYEPNECWICVPVSDDRPRFHPTGVRSILPDNLMRSAGGTLERLSINCDFLLDHHLKEALTFCTELRHICIANSRYYLDRTVISMLKHERVTCAIYNDHNNQERRYEFRCPDDPMSCEYDGALQNLVDMIATRWDKDGSTLRSFKVHSRDIEGFDEHPTIKRIRSSPRYCSPEWVVDL